VARQIGVDLPRGSIARGVDSAASLSMILPPAEAGFPEEGAAIIAVKARLAAG
jgi:hypothetical protein